MRFHDSKHGISRSLNIGLSGNVGNKTALLMPYKSVTAHDQIILLGELHHGISIGKGVITPIPLKRSPLHIVLTDKSIEFASYGVVISSRTAAIFIGDAYVYAMSVR
jgi:hypothetical protein